MMKQGAMLKRILFAVLLAACSMVPGVSVAQAQLAEEAQQVCAPDPHACILGEALHPEVLRCLKFPLQPASEPSNFTALVRIVLQKGVAASSTINLRKPIPSPFELQMVSQNPDCHHRMPAI